MRNLKLKYCKEDSTGIKHVKQLLQPIDIDHSPIELAYVVTDSKIYDVSNADKEPKVVAELSDIVGAEFLQLDNVICVATSMGEVLLIDPDTYETREGTFCDVGIECMAWSPNQEVVAFVTKAKNVVIMTCTYDVLGEHPLDAELASNQQFVNVGWGKKETQFHGAAGKQAAKQSATFQQPADVSELPQDVQIAWRGDGAYFAVSYVASNVGRTFNVYDNEGNLQYMAEKWNGLQPILAWRPSGNWIALPQVLPGKSTISLFEKNGLRHRELELPFDLQVETVVQLAWSSDSDILAIRTKSSEAQRIYIYTIGNYHWYLKQVLSYSLLDPVTFFHWSNAMEQRLFVCLESGKYFSYSWNTGVDCHKGIAAVIDGKRVLLTNLAKAVVPPPMSQAVLQLENYVNAIACNGSQLCVYTSGGQLNFYELEQLPREQKLLSSWQPGESLAGINLANLLCLPVEAGAGVALAATLTKGQKTEIVVLEQSKDSSNYHLVSSTSIAGTVNALTVDSQGKLFAHIHHTGHLYEISCSNHCLQPAKLLLQLRQPADYLQYSEAGLITLRSQQLLQLDGQRIDEDVTSYLLAEDYLIYTQLNTISFYHLPTSRKLCSRSIERGGKLVMHGPDARVVLQLPRGNLELIYPRVLALRMIGQLLDDRYYSEATQMLRKQRINLNIICDHNLLFFCTELDVFLREMPESQWLCLFISELQNEDYTLGMYASSYVGRPRNYPEDFRIERKVEYICERLCRLMEADQGERYRLPIITAYVKLGKLEQALLLIWQQKQTDAQQAEQMLKYLLYLVDVNDLYNVALGTYDFGLVLFVAQKSQKDPKEFLPYLNELKALPIDYRKFKIDEHLKRYERALGHLAACGAEHYELAMDFIKQHNLYSKALLAYEQQPEMHQRICVAFADQLRANAQLDLASIMYERGGQFQQALLSAKHTLDWQRVLLLAQRAGESLEQLANSMVAPLQQQNRHLEAYELLKAYGKPDTANVTPLEVLLQGHLYGRAIYEAGLMEAQGAEKLLAERVQPALIAYVQQLTSSLNADRELFQEHKKRLLELRQQKANQMNAMDGDHDVDIDELDLLSDTTSVRSSRYSGSSRGTGKTFRSSKNRRKHERKLLSLKPGNPFEDIALIDALHNQVTKIAHQQQQQLVHDTCKALLQLHTEDERASQLQQLYKCVLTMMQDSLDDIWIPELMSGSIQHLTGPNVDYLALQKEQRYALINPLKRFKPQLTIIDWQHSILQH